METEFQRYVFLKRVFFTHDENDSCFIFLQTYIGKLITILYALFGIPIMFLCLHNLGNLMANTFKFSYRRICCLCFCCSTCCCRRRRKSDDATKSSDGNSNGNGKKKKSKKGNGDAIELKVNQAHHLVENLTADDSPAKLLTKDVKINFPDEEEEDEIGGGEINGKNQKLSAAR